MRRLALILLVCSVALAASSTAVALRTPAAGVDHGAQVEASWARDHIRTVVTAGLLAPTIASFDPAQRVTRGEVFLALVRLGTEAHLPAELDAPVTVAELDAALVRAAGLRPQAQRVRNVLRRAGLRPRPYTGTETVARLLGFRFNHPQDDDLLELAPTAFVNKAEAAYSLAALIELGADRRARVREAVERLRVPQLAGPERALLRRAVRLVGNPYVFAGSSDRLQQVWRSPVLPTELPGGFDCSGLVWRVFKLDPAASGTRLASVISGRTTFQMSGEVRRGARIGLKRLRPADLLFFGSRGTKSRPAEVGHVGINLGSGWFVHSSSNGVTLEPFEGWYRTSFAWARRPLAEAGITV